ncbi:unnamed protein product, partial [Onchocerca flexuosa]|uniref:G_PROTEIN_RECEP_F1_2 domain-containing protein n=1 Tax=Onchocerca flexuosa TaxID=387005 RepID=A0A183H0D1_9BILA
MTSEIFSVKTAEIAKSELTVDSDMNELNLEKDKREKLKIFSDTFAMVSKITTLYSRKIDKENLKNGIGKVPKQYDGSGVYVNKSVNDDVKTIKIDDSDISDSEQNTSTARYKQAFFRFLQNDSKSKENSVIYVPQPEIYKFYELQNMNISGDESNMKDDRDQEQYLITNTNAEKYEVDIQQEKVKKHLKPNTDFVATKLLNDKSTSDENSTEIKQCDRQQWNSKTDGKTKWRGTEDIEKDSDDIDEAFGKTVKKYFILSNFRKKCKEKKLSIVDSSDSVKNSFMMDRTSKIFRTPLNRGNSFTGRHCSRTQRMEKRATKTLGIVSNFINENTGLTISGIFLACWVPFFSVYILSAICMQINIKSCQADFYAFFYTTWLGYINSCINPIIYTIFNI